MAAAVEVRRRSSSRRSNSSRREEEDDEISHKTLKRGFMEGLNSGLVHQGAILEGTSRGAVPGPRF